MLLSSPYNLHVSAKILACLLIFIHTEIYSSIDDYIYPNQDPSYSNYGTIGLISNPTARLRKEGTLAFNWARLDPYIRGSIIAYPFEWMEASYQYTEVRNKLYSQNYEFSGNQTFKDKGFDLKLRLLKESQLKPEISIGFRDAAGTGLFTSEYLVATKMLGNIDFTLGLGWGALSASPRKNPLINISDRFRARDKVEGSKGGEFTTDSFFSGDMGIFGGIEYFLPYLNGARIKIEYDGIDYSKEGFSSPGQRSKINYGLVYPFSKNLHFKIGSVRGNEFNISFSYTGIYAKKNPLFPKNDPPKKIENAKIIRDLNKKDTYFYRTSLQYLKNEGIYLQSANINKDDNTFALAYSQSKYPSYVLAAGRIARVLDNISPDYITDFKMTNLNANMGLNTIEINRKNFKNNDPIAIPDYTLENDAIYATQYSPDNFEYNPPTDLPRNISKFSPVMRSQIGGPDGFFFGDLRLLYSSELIFRKNITLVSRISAGIIDNFDDLKLASDSVLPHVRTDIVQYLKQSRTLAVERMQVNIFNHPKKEIYTKFSFGFLEPMFAGLGGEVLYRPFEKSWAIGAELWRVKQRAYKQNFKFRDYETTTGFVNLFYTEPRSKVTLKIKGGKFLAKDSGFNFDFSRRFSSGLQIGAFFSLTDISRAEFGEGSFDKGFYFHIPTDAFFSSYSKGFVSFGLRPLTRDGAAIINNSYVLWGVTDQANLYNVSRDWMDIYE